MRGTQVRAEEDWNFAHKRVDSPAYLRFATCVSLNDTSKPRPREANGDPHSLDAQVRDDKDAVRSLDDWNVGTATKTGLE